MLTVTLILTLTRWGLIYLLLVGWLRFAVPRGMSDAGAGADARGTDARDTDARGASRLRAASWLGLRVLIGTAVALQLL